MPRIRRFLSLGFFVCYLAIQCSLSIRSILSEVRRPYGFGMFNAKGIDSTPYRVVRVNGSREEFRAARGPAVLVFTSQQTDEELVYPAASRPLWDPRLFCAAHKADAVAIEWFDADASKRFDCPR